jgi:hypothetical protein
MCFGQQLLTAQTNQDGFKNHFITGESFRYYFQQYVGNPYFTDDWVLGSVQLVSGERYDSIMLNFDIYKDDLLYYHSKLKRIVLVDKIIVKEFRFLEPLTDKELRVVNLNLPDSSNLSSGYYFQLVDDTVSLFIKKRKTIDYYNNTVPNNNKLGKFYEETSYYYSLNGSYVKFSLRKRKLAKLFPQHYSQILSFISSNNYSIKDKDNLYLIFMEINHLLKNP